MKPWGKNEIDSNKQFRVIYVKNNYLVCMVQKVHATEQIKKHNIILVTLI